MAYTSTYNPSTKPIFESPYTFLDDSLSWPPDTISAFSSPLSGQDFLSTHELYTGQSIIPFAGNNPWWTFLFFMAGFIIVTILAVRKRKLIRGLLAAFFSHRHIGQLLRETNPLSFGFAFPVFLLSTGTEALLTVKFFQDLDLSPVSLLPSHFFLLVWLAYTLAQGLQFLMVSSSGQIFKTTVSSNAYNLNHFLFHLNISFLLLPFFFISYYAELNFLSYACTIIFALLYVWKVFYSFFIGLKERSFSVLHLILYLCTVEFLPLFILVKLVISTVL